MFELSEIEYNSLKDSLRSQFVISSITSQNAALNEWGGSRYAPFAFTEQGVSMLSAVLRSPIAIQTSISIMRAFVAIRQMLLNPPVDRVAELQGEVLKIKEYIEEVFKDQNDINEGTRIQLELVGQTLAELQVRNKVGEPRRPAGYKPNCQE